MRFASLRKSCPNLAAFGPTPDQILIIRGMTSATQALDVISTIVISADLYLVLLNQTFFERHEKWITHKVFEIIRTIEVVPQHRLNPGEKPCLPVI